MACPPRDDPLYQRISQHDLQLKVVRLRYDVQKMAHLKGWVFGPACLVKQIELSLEAREVPVAGRSMGARRAGKLEWFNALGQPVGLRALFGEGQGACYPCSYESFSRFRRLVHEAEEDLRSDVIELRLTVEEAVASLGRQRANGSKKASTPRLGTSVPDLSRSVIRGDPGEGWPTWHGYRLWACHDWQGGLRARAPAAI